MRAFRETKEHSRKERLDELFREASLDAKKIINMIIDEFKPKSVYQWGSLLDRPKFNELSDIDIAVEGLSGADDFFLILAKAGELTTFPIDLVELDKVMPVFAAQIKRQGKVVYEQSSS